VASGASLVFARRHINFLLSTGDSVISKKIYQAGTCEYHKFRTALRILGIQQVRHFIDVGANIGELSIRSVCESDAIQATAIEAEQGNFRLLEINARLNGLGVDSRLRLIHGAAGTGDPSRVNLKMSAENWGDHQVVSPLATYESEFLEQSVANIRIDDLFPALTKNDYLLWIDVQGYESHVLAGAERLIGTRIPIVLEISPMHLENYSSCSELLARIDHYSGYYDLGLHSPTLQDWDKLSVRYELLKSAQKHTDILVV
jgi:FkbM family methyltransferase